MKITPAAPIPTSAITNVKSCGGGATVSVNADPAIVSYNWWVPYAGWTISDGSQPPFSTFDNNSSFVTSRNANITIYPRSKVAPGDYVIYFSANGGCGEKSADGQLTVTIDFHLPPAPTRGYFSQTASSTPCFRRYNLRTSPVAGATSYEATLSTGETEVGRLDSNTGQIVFFNLAGPLSGVSAQIFAIGPCGRSAPYNVPARDLDGLRSQDSAARPVPCNEVPQFIKAYPNPATNFLTLQAKSDASVGYLYNNQGKIMRTISLDRSNVSKVLDTSGLPNGLYNLIIESPTHERHMEHIIIEH